MLELFLMWGPLMCKLYTAWLTILRAKNSKERKASILSSFTQDFQKENCQILQVQVNKLPIIPLYSDLQNNPTNINRLVISL